VQIVVVLAVLLLGLKLATQTDFYVNKLVWPALSVPFLAFAGFVVAVLAFGIVPTLGYFDRVFLDWSLGGRALTLLAGLAVLLAAWPGWLGTIRQDPAQTRHAAWAVEPDPSLTRVAEHLARLRDDGVIKEGDRPFAVAPQVGGYCAWYCPEERSYFDHRFGLFSQSAAAYLDFRHTLELISETVPADDQRKADDLRQRVDEGMARLRKAFEDNHITHLVLTLSDRTDPAARLLLRMSPLMSDPGQWPLIYVDGRTAVFGFRPDPKAVPDAWSAVLHDADALAYGRDTPAVAPRGGAPDPVNSPDWVVYMNGVPPRSLDTDRAQWDLLRFTVLGGSYNQESHRAFLAATASGLVASANPAAGAVAAPGLLGYRLCVDGAWFPQDPSRQPLPRSGMVDQLAMTERALFIQDRDHGPPALPLLAVRAGRRAVADNPQDVVAYLRLEAAYATQRWSTRERAWCEQMGELPILRHVQQVAALEHALTIQSDLPSVHLELAKLYRECRAPSNGLLGYLDLQMKHLREALRLVRRGAPQSRETEKEYREQLADLERQVNDLEKAVKEQQDRYIVAAGTKASALDRARDALRRGLAEDALAVLKQTSGVELGPAGGQLEIELLLTTGQLAEARGVLNDPEGHMEEALGDVSLGQLFTVPAFHWYQLLLAAAEGNYAEADKHCKAMIDLRDPHLAVPVPAPPGEGPAGGLPRERYPNLEPILHLLANDLAEVPQEKPLGWLAAWQFSPVRAAHLRGVLAVGIAQQNWAELTVLRGMLALEAGDTEHAAAYFRQAVSACFPPARFLPFVSLLGAASPLEAAALVPPSAQAAVGPLFDFNGRQAAVRCTELLDAAAARKK
jgi:hypothetical protein